MKVVPTISDEIPKYITVLVVAILVFVFMSPIVVLWERNFNIEISSLSLLLESFVLSIITSFLSSLLIFVFSIPVAFYLATLRCLPRKIIETVVMIPVILSPSATGSLILLFFARNPVGSILNRVLGILNDPKGIIIAQFAIGYPIAVLFYTALFSSIPRVYEEVALEAGLSRLEYLYRVLLPMTKGQVLLGLILVYARVFADFGASLVVGGGIRGKTWTLPIYIYMTTQYGDITILSLTLILYLLVTLALLYALHTVREIASSPV